MIKKMNSITSNSTIASFIDSKSQMNSNSAWSSGCSLDLMELDFARDRDFSSTCIEDPEEKINKQTAHTSK